MTGLGSLGFVLHCIVAKAAGGLGLLGALALLGAQETEPTAAAYRARRLEMVKRQIHRRGIHNPAVLEALATVPRHRFVPWHLRALAYEDEPLPIGHGQTISQPYIVGLMTELIEPEKSMRVLEIGTGSGYQAAVLAQCVAEVDTIEVVPELGRAAASLFADLALKNVQTKIGDGYEGWPERAPYDAIVLTAAPPRRIPQPLLDQLKVGGRLVAPLGRYMQDLVRIRRTARGYDREVITSVQFVPMTGRAQQEWGPVRPLRP
jgi:protein-L-isoaspartate(D-aspartate) O-methyltransferase